MNSMPSVLPIHQIVCVVEIWVDSSILECELSTQLSDVIEIGTVNVY